MTDVRLQEELLDLDARIAELVEERAQKTRELGEGGGTIPFDARRVEALAGRTPSLPPSGAKRLFASYFAAFEAIARPRTLAVVAGESAEAALSRQGDDRRLVVCAEAAEALAKVAAAEADAAVLRYQRPGEAPLAGALDALARSEGRIVHLFEDEGLRYAVVALRPAPKSGVDRTAFLVRVKDAPGALQNVLAGFSAHRVNIATIHSCPGASGDYRFFLECDGHATDRPLVAALDDVRPLVRDLRVLGSYVGLP